MNRVILIGASNLTLAFPRLVAALPPALPAPLEIWAAHGHGRSFGNWSKVLGRTLPGIVDCRLWEELQAAESAAESAAVEVPPLALVADIGNDILYGIDNEQIAAWIETCLVRLQAYGARTVMTRLPLQSLATLSRTRYAIAKGILFPRCRLTLAEVLQRAEGLDVEVARMAGRFGTTLVEPEGRWFGFDPIHILGRWRDRAWQQILAGWFPDGQVPAFPRVPIRQAVLNWNWYPAERGRLRRVRRTPQPVHEEPGLVMRLY